MSTGKTLQLAGGALAVVMLFLASRIGTTNAGLFATWILLILVGVGALVYGRRLEDRERKRRLDADFDARRAANLDAEDRPDKSS